MWDHGVTDSVTLRVFVSAPGCSKSWRAKFFPWAQAMAEHHHHGELRIRVNVDP
jgi:hypothetical protein